MSRPLANPHANGLPKRILALLRESGSLNRREIAEALVADRRSVTDRLIELRRDHQVVRYGDRGRYTFGLPVVLVRDRSNVPPVRAM